MPRLRSWEAMDPRAAGVNDRLGAKDQLCAPQVFTFGHVRQLDRLSGELLARAWSLGAGPGEEPMTDENNPVDPICQVQRTRACSDSTR